MKKILTLLAFIAMLVVPVIAESQTIKEKEELYDGFMPTFVKIIKQREKLDMMAYAFEIVESKCNTRAINHKENSVGILAIRRIMVDEANRLLKLHDGIDFDYFEYDDRWDKSYSELIFCVIMVHKNPTLDLQKACVVWNKYGGKSYINKVEQAYNKVKKETNG